MQHAARAPGASKASRMVVMVVVLGYGVASSPTALDEFVLLLAAMRFAT